MGRVCFSSTASVERLFSEMKVIKPHLQVRSRLSDSNLEHLMKTAIEGPRLTDVDFDGILDISKQRNRRSDSFNFVVSYLLLLLLCITVRL